MVFIFFDFQEKSKSVGCVIFERKKDALNAIGNNFNNSLIIFFLENMNHAIFNGRDISVKMSKK